ncbi:hypothetical protein ECG_01121 [Echinococcus granulosus]|uniref:Expressed protein n=1 Tax=Echinococcus granulosus TaxID=6210 RepID=A0A068WEA7_ECHGR|nr:hypothetical protein ECG_01121 [Echinococcus granulosus]CDS15986.1 expressed protein [Echinococcus granulosus]
MLGQKYNTSRTLLSATFLMLVLPIFSYFLSRRIFKARFTLRLLSSLYLWSTDSFFCASVFEYFRITPSTKYVIYSLIESVKAVLSPAVPCTPITHLIY